jgi:transposase-like protein
MVTCKHCNSTKIVKNGVVREKQRYLCKECGYNFVKGDARTSQSVVVKKALSVILYSLGKSSYGMIGKIFGISRSLVYRWIAEESDRLPGPTVSGSITEMEFDEMWHFIGSKKTSCGSSKPWIVAQGELSPGLSVIVMLQHSENSTIKSST